MEVKVVKYDQSWQKAWDDFVVNSSRNGGIFHEQSFLSYHPNEKYIDESVLLLSGDKIKGVFPAARIRENEVVSHPGSTAGGLIFDRKATLKDVLVLLDCTIDHYKKSDVKSLELILEESIFSNPSDDELRYLLWHRGFVINTREISSCVDLRSDKEWESFGRKRNLTYINSLLKKGAVVEDVASPEIIYPLIENNLKGRYEKKPTHSLEELKLIKSKYPDRVHFWCVFLDGVPVATIVTFDVNKNAVHDFYIAQDYNHSKAQPMTLLFYKVFEYYKEKGMSWFNFGISSRKDWIKWGILEFKERMGGRATYRESWRLQELSLYEPYKFEEE